MQQYPLLQTKLYIPPIRPELVSRPRLIERLTAGLDRKIAVISAPAGFGKTTLVSDWVQAMGRAAPPIAIAWLSLGEGDNDPARFLAYMIAALRTIEPRQESDTHQEPVGLFGQGALSALQSPGVAGATTPPPAEVVLTSLINEITAIPKRILLVLDDYHLIEAQPIHDTLTFLVEHLPPPPGGMHLVIATREDPHLPFARLRARGQLTEVRASDLRFTSSEAAEFLNQVMGLDLSAEDIAVLETRTEGWIAGLQLAALSMQGRQDTSSLIQSFTGSHRFVLDYLIEEVLEQQTESIQTFLLQTSVLNRLTGSLCDAVRFGIAETPTGQDNGRATLEMLEHANLFIVPLDEERRWYRYHHLFADLLRQRLRQTQPEWVRTLHLRASEWYEQNGFADEAIEHALRAKQFERAASLIEERAEPLWQRGEHAKLGLWLGKLPAELVRSNPQLCIYHAWHLFSGGQLDAAEQALRAATAEQDLLQKSNRRQLQGRVAASRSYIASHRGDVPGIIQYARRALEYLPKHDSAWRSGAAIALGDAYAYQGDMEAAHQARLDALEISKAADNIYLSLTANLKLAIIHRQQGRMRRAIEICRQQTRLAAESGTSQAIVVGGLLATWGEALIELNDLDGGLEQAKAGAELAERSGDVAMLSWTYLSLTRGYLSRGDIAAAQETIEQIQYLAREYDMPPWIASLMAAWQARIWLAQDRLEAARQWAEECGLDSKRPPAPQYEMELMVLARLLIDQGRADEATSLLQRLLEAAESGSRTASAVEILLLQALAFQAEGDVTRAMAALERALALAEPGGFVRVFVDEGPPMARLLCEAATRGIAQDYVRRLLAAFPVAEPEQADSLKTQTPRSQLVEPLSEREIEVLQLIAEGLTNPEIASRLFISLNTVKAHCRNIYGKLGVNNRTQA